LVMVLGTMFVPPAVTVVRPPPVAPGAGAGGAAAAAAAPGTKSAVGRGGNVRDADSTCIAICLLILRSDHDLIWNWMSTNGMGDR
jgi:hypothetical protein